MVIQKHPAADQNEMVALFDNTVAYFVLPDFLIK